MMKPILAFAAICLFPVAGFCQSNPNDEPATFEKYREDLKINRADSLAHYRQAQLWLRQRNFQASANELSEAMNGNKKPAWTEVWSHICLGKIFDITDQRERAIKEYRLAVRTGDDTQGAQAEASKYLKSPYREK